MLALYLLPTPPLPRPSLFLSPSFEGGILASLARIRMRLVLLTVEGKGLSLEIQKKATSGTRDHGEIAERGKKRIKTKSGGRSRRKKRRRHQEVERSENYSQGISLEHPPRRRAVVEEVGGGGRGVRARKVVQPFYPLRSFSLTHAPFAPASLFVFTLGASRGGCVKARL